MAPTDSVISILCTSNWIYFGYSGEYSYWLLDHRKWFCHKSYCLKVLKHCGPRITRILSPTVGPLLKQHKWVQPRLRMSYGDISCISSGRIFQGRTTVMLMTSENFLTNTRHRHRCSLERDFWIIVVINSLISLSSLEMNFMIHITELTIAIMARTDIWMLYLEHMHTETFQFDTIKQ